MKDSSIDFSGSACILGAFLLLTVPIRWLAAALAAAMIHECGHAAAVLLSGGKITALRIGPFGACMDVTPLTPGKEYFCTLAGPAASLFLLLFADCFPRIALCGMVQGLYNLMPVYPMDGGRMLQCVLQIFAGEQTRRRVTSLVEGSFCCLLVFAGVAAVLFQRIGLIPALMLTVFACSRKIPCKAPQHAVQ